MPRDRWALWSGLTIDLARKRNLVTLEMAPLGASLGRGTLKAELDVDFGERSIAEDRLIFGISSRRFVRGLTGQ